MKITLGISDALEDCLSICETAEDAVLGPNGFASAHEHETGAYLVTLAHPIAAGAVTRIGYADAGTVRYTSHPANANGDDVADAADVTSLIAYLDGGELPPHGIYSTDIDHSGAFNAADALRALDLLNGAETYAPWAGTALPSGCP